MFNKTQIGEYMVFGFIKDFHYNSPVGKNYDISFEEAKEILLKNLISNIREIEETYPNAIYTLSGGLDASFIVSQVKDSHPKTICVEGKPVDRDNSRLLVSKWNTRHIALDLDISLPQALREINCVWPIPHQAFPGNAWMWKLMKIAKEESDVLVVGTGSGSLLHEYFRFPEQEEMLYYSIKRKDYDLSLARRIFENSKYPDPEGYFKLNKLLKRKIVGRGYTEYFTDIYSSAFFNKKDLSEFDVCLPEYPLEVDNLEHFLQWSQDWLMQGHELDRYEYWGNALGVKVISPFFMNGFDKFLLSLPYEYCDCMGYPRHVYREAIGDYLPEEIMYRERGGLNTTIDWHIENFDQHQYLFDRYIKSKNNRIYEFLDYDKVVALFNFQVDDIKSKDYQEFHKLFNLVNLSIWLDINYEN